MPWKLTFMLRFFFLLFRSFEENAFHDTDGNFMWNSSTNFVSILNLPNNIEKFVDLSFYWEGSKERFIQLIKPWMKNVRKTRSLYYFS